MSRPLLLDSCTIIWIIEERDVKPAAAEAIDAAAAHGDSLFVSPITAWEYGMLFAKGRLRLSVTAQEYWRRVMALEGIELAPMPPEVLMASWYLPDSPLRDPWDRIIAATAREFGFTVMTRDAALFDYAGQGHLSAVEC